MNEPPTAAPDDRRARGLAAMADVYSFEVRDGPGDFYGMTVEHLFGEVWTREALDVRDRRLLTIGVLAANGMTDLVGLQFESALDKGELTEEQVREVVLHLAHYAGWPIGAALNTVAESVLGRRSRSDPPVG